MKKLLLVTYVDFWRIGSGHRTRINSIVNYLKDKIKITVFFTGNKLNDEEVLLNTIYSEVDFVFAASDKVLTYKDCIERFRWFIEDKFFDYALIEYLELSGVLEYLPETTKTILDTHDIVYSRIESFNKCNVEYDGIVLTKEEELNIYGCYDYIILIQKSDYEHIAKEIDTRNLLLVPHPAVLKKKKIYMKVKNVGYIASAYRPNIDAFNWFVNKVWNDIYLKYQLVLNVYGNICQGYLAESHNKSNIIFHGFVDDLEKTYNDLDIIINPVRCGAGLKIKNVEALGYGVPLITTTHGASGMEDGASKAFLIASTPEEFLLAFDCIMDHNKRLQISNNAFEYAQTNFSKEKCYADIIKIISNNN